MHPAKLRSNLLLLLTALIWGFAFVAQRVGMEYVGPYLFNGARFALGALPLVPFGCLPQQRFLPRPAVSCRFAPLQRSLLGLLMAWVDQAWPK